MAAEMWNFFNTENISNPEYLITCLYNKKKTNHPTITEYIYCKRRMKGSVYFTTRVQRYEYIFENVPIYLEMKKIALVLQTTYQQDYGHTYQQTAYMSFIKQLHEQAVANYKMSRKKNAPKHPWKYL